ncbi:MAG TPA: cell wall hydrolase [Erythrobacter sp.]|nr:cell wall hydrolase [Erythrobacter sp.]
MQPILPRVILTVMAALSMPVGASAQDAGLADWQAPARFLPPAIGTESPVAAVQCLALAITYEAGLEPVTGQEAVAQVILNRVRSSAYPDTVCGVVWQGSHRRTGCQFTFTCDGSLRRPRSPAALFAAQRVAVRVLAGESADHVRGATHYHANYVSPYWAPSLTRVRQIATHIFYRSPGARLRGDGAPIRVALSAPAEPQAAAPTPADPAPASEPAIRNGEYAPWGLSVGSARR